MNSVFLGVLGFLKCHKALVILALFTTLFISNPGLDIRFSQLFYEQQAGFYLRDNMLVDLIYEGVPYLVSTLLLILGISLASAFLNRPVGTRRYKAASLYMFLLLIVGPGLFVNTIFKDQWDRARPRAVIEFGGEQAFTPAWVISDQCEDNCSFVSGHAAAGFYFLGLAFLFPARRNLWLGFAISFGGLIGVTRVMQGGHFLSDVVFSFFAVYFVAKFLYWLMFKRNGIDPLASTSTTS